MCRLQVAALKSLKLNIRRARIKPAADGTHVHKFFITDANTSEKILKSARLEEIRLTILNNLLQVLPNMRAVLHWVCSDRLAEALWTFENRVFSVCEPSLHCAVPHRVRLLSQQSYTCMVTS